MSFVAQDLTVTHFSFSRTGGAGRVAQRLNDGLTTAGANSSLICLTETNLRQDPLSNPSLTIRGFLDHQLVAKKDNPIMFSYFRNKFSSLSASYIHDLSDDSIIHLHWVTGLLTLQEIAKLSTSNKIVWTVHDSAVFSGGCHQLQGCKRIEFGCSECPQVEKNYQTKVQKYQAQRKIIGQGLKLAIVSPSTKILMECKKSEIFSQATFHVIPNPVSDEFYETVDLQAARQSLGLASKDRVLALVAQDLSDPNKNLNLLHEAIGHLSINSEDSYFLLAIGQNLPVELASSSRVMHFKPSSPREVATLLAASDLNFNLSFEESFSLTVAESAALGVPSIVAENNPIREFISSLAGIVRGYDPREVAMQISKFFAKSPLEKSELRHALTQESKTFELNAVVAKYKEVYSFSA